MIQKLTPPLAHPGLIAALYLALIPTFAVVYAQHGDEFQVSVSDSTAVKHREELDRRLTAAIDAAIYHVPNSRPPLATVLHASATRRSLERIGEQSFFIEIMLDQRVETYVCVVRVGSNVLNWSGGLGPGVDVVCPDNLNGSQSVRFSDLLPNPTVPLAASTLDLLHQVENEVSGGVGVGYARIPRMLYLSVITITTVGFGDIVPMTDAMRLAVALEAIAGVVLVGLFLNAVGHRLVQRYEAIGVRSDQSPSSEQTVE